MFRKLGLSKFSRRRFLGTTAAAAGAAAISGISTQVLAADKVIKIGFLAPLTGPVSAWGKPGLDGCEIWAEWINAAGGIKLADGDYMVEFVGYDNEYDPAKARTGATKLIREDGVSFVMMLGGDTWPGAQPVADKTGMLFSTLLPLGPRAGHRHAAGADRGTPDLQRHRGRMAGREQARAEDRGDVRPRRRAGPAFGRHLSGRLRGRGHRDAGRALAVRPGDHRLRAGGDQAALPPTRRSSASTPAIRTMSTRSASSCSSRATRARSSPAPPTSTSRSSPRPRWSSWKASSSSSRISTIRR